VVVQNNLGITQNTEYEETSRNNYSVGNPLEIKDEQDMGLFVIHPTNILMRDDVLEMQDIYKHMTLEEICCMT